MARFQDAWLTHQRQRFMRPDAARYVRNDAGRYMRPDAFRWLPPGSVDAGAAERKYRADQARVPAGEPDGGQWTDEDGGGGEGGGGGSEEILSELADLTDGDLAKLFEFLFEAPNQSEPFSEPPSDDAELILAAGKGVGHHWVPRELWAKEKFSQEALDVFKKAVTGPLNDPTSNFYDGMHRQYSTAVGQSLNQFLTRNGISADQMTSDQARQFVDEVKRSNDPRIRQFNMRLWMREFQYHIRRMPRGEA
ncbi:MAG: hypothetical protein AB1490_10980 [Pseudomonadota bacterium]